MAKSEAQAQATPEDKWFKAERAPDGGLRLYFQPTGELTAKYVPVVSHEDNAYTWGDSFVASFVSLADHLFALEEHFKTHLTNGALFGLKHILEPFVFNFIQGKPVPTFPWNPTAANGDAAQLVYAAYQLWASFIGLYFCGTAVLDQAHKDLVPYVRTRMGQDGWLTPGVRPGEPTHEGKVREAHRVWSSAVVSRLEAAGFQPQHANTLPPASLCAYLPGGYPSLCSCGRPKLSSSRFDKMQSLPSFCGRDDKHAMSRDANDCRTGYLASSLVLQSVGEPEIKALRGPILEMVGRCAEAPETTAELKALRRLVEEDCKGDPVAALILDLCRKDGPLTTISVRTARPEAYNAVGGAVLGIAASMQHMIAHMDAWSNQAAEISAEADPRPQGQPRRLVTCGVALEKAGVVLQGGGVAELARGAGLA